MKNITTNDILKATGGTVINPPADLNKPIMDGTFIDSRYPVKDGMFIAIKGERVDGHDYVARAFEGGASVALCSKEIEGVTGTCILVEDTVKALQELARWYRRSLNIKVVGITGSVGKTSTKEIVASVLAAKFKVHKTVMNHNNEIGLPMTVLSIDSDCEIAVLEMGISDFGEMRLLSSIAEPDVCVITNIGQAHLEFLGSLEGVLKAKSEIFEHMNPEGRIYLYGDDAMLRTVKEVRGITPVFYGLEASNAAYATDLETQELDGTTMTINLKDTSFKAQINIPGKHMVINAVAGAIIAHDFGMSDEEIIQGIFDAKTVSGRCNVIRYKNGRIIDDCYNASPTSMRSAIDTLCLGNGRRVAILGDMFEMGDSSAELHRGVGHYVAGAKIDKLICVGPAAKFICEGAKEKNSAAELVYIETLNELIEKLTDYVLDDDIILVKSSNGMGFSRLVKALAER